MLDVDKLVTDKMWLVPSGATSQSQARRRPEGVTACPARPLDAPCVRAENGHVGRIEIVENKRNIFSGEKSVSKINPSTAEKLLSWRKRANGGGKLPESERTGQLYMASQAACTARQAGAVGRACASCQPKQLETPLSGRWEAAGDSGQGHRLCAVPQKISACASWHAQDAGSRAGQSGLGCVPEGRGQAWRRGARGGESRAQGLRTDRTSGFQDGPHL